jgi:hypothetical protein
MNSPKRLARIAGGLYLLLAIFAAFAERVYVKLYVAGDAATTAANVAENPGLVRMAVVADLAEATLWIFLALTLYQLLKHVDLSAVRAMVTLVAIGTGLVCLNTVFEFEGMRVATGSSYAAALGAGGSNGLVLLLLDIQHYGIIIASVFMGLWLLPFGYLATKSRLFPKALGVGLIVAGVCALAKVLAAFLAHDLWTAIHGYFGIPMWVFEGWMVLYLLIIGVRAVKQDVHTPGAA